MDVDLRIGAGEEDGLTDSLSSMVGAWSFDGFVVHNTNLIPGNSFRMVSKFSLVSQNFASIGFDLIFRKFQRIVNDLIDEIDETFGRGKS